MLHEKVAAVPLARGAIVGSKISDNSNSVEDASPRDEPPNGGLHAWQQVAGSFFLFFNSWGTVNTFGAFQTFYQEDFLFVVSPSDISLIGSTQTFLLLIVGVASGPLYDIGYFKTLIVVGSLLVFLGTMMTSLGLKYWEILLSQAICTGIGAGLTYIPFVAILPQYFSTRKVFATAIATSGSSLGGVIYPIIFQQLQPKIGFSWATRCIGFVNLATCFFAVIAMRARLLPKQRRMLIEIAAFKEAPYAIFCAAMFFAYLGFFIPIFYVQPYALEARVMSTELAVHLVPILNAASVPGRIIPGILARKGNPVAVLFGAAAVSGVLGFAWIGIHNAGGIVAFAVLYGFFSGAFVALPAVVLTALTPDPSTLGTRMGMCSTVCSLGSLCGAPVAGALLSNTSGYHALQLFSAVATLMTGALLGGQLTVGRK
ncbi:hypothetical protein MMC29_001860 [Sticta canariensis]|nr:hypothetical protein [Sticta canariensis]